MKNFLLLKSNKKGTAALVLLSFLLIMGLYFLVGTNFISWLMFCSTAIAAVCHSVFLVRTGNNWYGAFLLFYSVIALTFLSLLLGLYFVLPFISALAIVLFVFQIYALSSQRIRWRNRDVLKLAVLYHNGKPEGKDVLEMDHKISMEEEKVICAAKLMLKHGIVIPFFEKDRIDLYIPRNMFFSLLFKRFTKKKGDTFISVIDRHIFAKPNHQDYEEYKEHLNYKEFCGSLEHLFLDALSLCEKDRAQKFIDELDHISKFA